MAEIERVAEEFLGQIPSYVWDGTTLPVPIEEIADTHAGLLVRDVEDLGTAPGAPELGHGQTLSGLLLPAVGEIWVNAEEARQWPARRRFTIAHELGHWRLHRDTDHGVFCRSGSIEPEAPQTRAPSQPLRTRPTCSPLRYSCRRGWSSSSTSAVSATSPGCATRSAHPARRWAAGCTP